MDGSALLPLFTGEKVCIKQLYTLCEGGKGIARLKGRYELWALLTEFNCLRWALLLLDLSYKFITQEIEKKGQSLARPIPQLQFMNTMITVVQETKEEKVFLIEEWIHTDEGNHQFVKYINNCLPTSWLPIMPPLNALNIAEFLLFAQYIQWAEDKFHCLKLRLSGCG